MGKKKPSGYNDFLDGEKLTDNNEIRTTLQSSASLTRDQRRSLS
jgi:activating signal cointegrator complex subunit 1